MKQPKTKKKKLLRWLALGLAILLMGLVISYYVSFYGNPLLKMKAEREIAQYLKETYHDRVDLEIGELSYNFKDGRYTAQISSQTSPDTHFEVGWHPKMTMRDTYSYQVTDGGNTLARLHMETQRDIEAKLRDLGEFKVFINNDKQDVMPKYPMDVVYTSGIYPVQGLHLELKTEEHKAEVIADMAPKLFQRLSEIGFGVPRLDLSLTKDDFKLRYDVYAISEELANAPDFLDQLKQMEQQFRDDPDAVWLKEGFRVIVH